MRWLLAAGRMAAVAGHDCPKTANLLIQCPTKFAARPGGRAFRSSTPNGRTAVTGSGVDCGKRLSMWIDERRNRLPTPFLLPRDLRTILLVLLAASLFSSSGCRVFRSHKVSDESIAAARQLSLQGIDAQQPGHWDRAEMLVAAAILKCALDEPDLCRY